MRLVKKRRKKTGFFELDENRVSANLKKVLVNKKGCPRGG